MQHVSQTPGQACMALQAGAKIISFFWGKMTDEGISPKCHIENTKRQIQDRALDAKILAVPLGNKW